MDDATFRAFLIVLMCDDHPDTDPVAHELLVEWAEAQSKARGFDGWIDAYHEIPEGGGSHLKVVA